MNWRTRGVMGLGVVLLAMCASENQAATTSLVCVADSFIISSALDNNAGGHTHVAAGTDGNGGNRRGLYRFDLSSIPAGSTITSVVFRVAVTKESLGDVDADFSLYRVTADWNEGVKVGNPGSLATAGEATWRSRQHGTATWTSAGGDFVVSPSATVFVGATGTSAWADTNLVTDAALWLAHPEQNFGLLLRCQSEGTTRTAKRFGSREGFSPAALEVGFNPPPPPPLGPIVLTARLDGAQEVPPQATAATGIGLFSYDRGTRTLTWYITHSVSNATAAHIHGPAGVGTNAAPVVTFASAVSPIRGSTNLTPVQAEAMFNGRYYVNVHSAAIPAGEIRGQLLAKAGFAGLLEGAQQVPPVASANEGAAFLEYDHATRQARWLVQHTLTNASAAHIHGPTLRGANAAVLVDLGAGGSPISGVATLSVPNAAALVNGFCYINVHNPPNPSGELRGQMDRLHAPPLATHAAVLDASQEVSPTANAFRGAAVVGYDYGTRTLHYALQHDVDAASAIHIHGPALTGTNAAVLFNLGFPDPALEGRVTLTPAQEADLLAGRYYFNIHSATFPSGAIRGQILPRADFTAVLTGDQESPPLTVAERGAAVFTYAPPTRVLTYTIVHGVSNATAAHIHGPADPGVAAGVRHPLPASSVATGSVTLTSGEARDLHAGRLYVNVHDAAFPAGRIRGQILPSEPVPRTTHTAVLDGAAEVPANGSTNRAIGLFAYDCETRLLRFEIQHTLAAPSAAHIHGPALPGTNAPPVFGFASTNSPIRGVVPLTSLQAAEFLAGQYYVNVHSASFPGGEIRGQILPHVRFAANLQPRQELNHPAVAALGLGVFHYDAATRAFQYRVEHTVAAPTAGHIHGPADPGANASPSIDFGAAVQSPITGVVTLSVGQATTLLQGRFYVNIHSAAFPAGEARGQLHETRPDTDCNTIDDHFEAAYGLSPGGYNPGSDDDMDGHSILQEYEAGTDPTNTPSVAAIDAFTHVDGTTTVSFATSPSRLYLVQRSSNLMQNAWQDVGATFFGNGSPVPVVETNDASPMFYRLGVMRP